MHYHLSFVPGKPHQSFGASMLFGVREEAWLDAALKLNGPANNHYSKREKSYEDKNSLETHRSPHES